MIKHISSKLPANLANKKGSALIITLLMITVIASVSFAVTALAISEFRKAATIQDSIVAYYAAESGIEHGLMEYRLWHDAEISTEVYAAAQLNGLGPDQDKIPTADSKGDAQTFRLTDAQNAAPAYIPPGGNPGKVWYDLKAFYRGDKVGEVDSSGKPVVDGVKSPRVKRDSAAEYNIEGATSMHLVWQPDQETKDNPPAVLESSDARYFLELTFTLRDGASCPNAQHRILKVTETQATYDTYEFALTCDYKSVRIKPWNMKHAQYSFLVRDAKNKQMKVDQLKTTFQSTGYSGSAKRTLELEVSRTIGTIVESGDFLFLSGDKPLTF